MPTARTRPPEMTMEELSSRFLDVFTSVEKHLREVAEADST